MVKYCVVAGCSNTVKNGVSVHTFPKDDRIKNLWTRFVKLTRVDFVAPTANSVICSAHFKEDCYEVQTLQLKSLFGIPSKRRLIPNSIPSIYPKRPQPDVMNEGFLISPEKKRKISSAIQKRNRDRVLQEIMNKPIPEPEPEPEPEIEAQDTNQLEIIEMPAIPFHSEEITISSMVNAECQTEMQRKPHRSARVQVQPKMEEKAIQINIEPRYRSLGIQCNLPIQRTDSKPKEAKKPEVHQDTPDISDHSDPDDHSASGDPNFQPSWSDSSESTQSGMSHEDNGSTSLQERKFIIGESQLLELFKTCPACNGAASGTIAQVIGTMVRVEVLCELCAHSYSWNSQPLKGSVPVGNLAISSSILFSGALPSKILRLMKFCNIAMISEKTFFNHQRHFLYPSILNLWNHHQSLYISEARKSGQPIVIGGDGRADTPGHSAKFGSYSMVDLDKGVVVDVELVQSNEVSSSNAMEKEGLIRGLKWLREHHIKVKTLVTDQHGQIVKYMRENEPQILHYFDVWHVAKGLKKKLANLSRETECSAVGEWIKSLTNHLYWVAASTQSGNGEEMVAKWLSVANHVQNVHTGHSDLFPHCLHNSLEDSTRQKKWLKPGTKASVKLEELVTNTRLKTSVRKLSPLHQTSHVEAYHSTVIHFAPKMIGFSFHGMYCRLLLAALHFNENSGRPQAFTAEGVPRYAIEFPKYKRGEYIAREKKVDATFGYVTTLFEEVSRISETVHIRDRLVIPVLSPEPLCSKYEKPDKQTAVSKMKSRFF